MQEDGINITATVAMNLKHTTSNMVNKKHKKAEPKHKPSTKRTLEDILTSLQDLAKNELATPNSRENPDKQENTSVSENPETGELTDLANDDLEVADNDQIEIDVPASPELKSGETGDIFEGLELLSENELAGGETEAEEIRWEDIPVLEDVAEDPDQEAEFEIPDPKLARKIAIQVAARLNIEMHKQGLDGLDIATINRLRALLVKELAKAAANRENDET